MKTVDITTKFDNLRTARAKGRIRLSPETVRMILDGKIPKGDVLTISQVAGMSGAKRTAELVPFCHPIPIDHIEVSTRVGEDFVEVEAEVRGIWRTGYEVEAVNAVMMALLNIFDMCKAFDDSMVIEGIRIVSKSGGKSDWAEDLSGLKAAVVTVSDSAYEGRRADRSGELAVELLRGLGAEVVGYQVVPDEALAIRKAVEKFRDEGVNLVVTTGGTGFSFKDVTPEALKPLLVKSAEGFSEAMRVLGVRFTPKALMSRGIAGFLSQTCMLITLPGSTSGVEQNLKFLAPLIKHAIKMAGGGGH